MRVSDIGIWAALRATHVRPNLCLPAEGHVARAARESVRRRERADGFGIPQHGQPRPYAKPVDRIRPYSSRSTESAAQPAAPPQMHVGRRGEVRVVAPHNPRRPGSWMFEHDEVELRAGMPPVFGRRRAPFRLCYHTGSPVIGSPAWARLGVASRPVKVLGFRA